MGAVTIRRLTNQDAGFYPLLGPFLARRSVVEAVGGPVWDDDGKQWFVAMDRRDLAGFGAVVLSGRSASFCSDYLVPGVGHAAVREELIRARLEYVVPLADRVLVVAGQREREAYEAAGFEAGRRTANFTHMEKRLK